MQQDSFDDVTGQRWGGNPPTSAGADPPAETFEPFPSPPDRFPNRLDRKKRHFAYSEAEYARMGTHLVNQLLGRRNTQRFEAFDELLPQLKPQTKLHPQFDSIQVVGFDLTVDQQRALQAGLKILRSPFCDHLRAVISRKDWLDAFALPMHGRQSDHGGGDDARRAFQALEDLASKVWLIYYERQNPDGTWTVIEEPGARLWSIRQQYDFLSDEERRLLTDVAAPNIPPEIENKLQAIEITYHPIWLDQARQYYTKVPLHLHTQYYLLRRRKRPPKHVYNFTLWVIDQMTRKYLANRNQGGDWRVSISTVELAQLCRMQPYLEKRQNARIKAALEHDAEFTRELGYLTDFTVDEQTVVIQLDADKAREIQETGRVEELRKAAEEPKRMSRAEFLLAMPAVQELIAHLTAKLTLDAASVSRKEQIGFLMAFSALAKRFHDRGVALPMTQFKRVLTAVAEKVLSHARGGLGAVNSLPRYVKKSLVAYVDEHFDELYEAAKRFRDLQDPTSRTYSKQGAAHVSDQAALFEQLATLQTKHASHD
ncbi:MAG: hypothetical protein JO069_10060 [Verrucomicrobia bacterium]|nr:hypothetical protein [Verrucomicrobiota bacterium]